MHQRLPRATPPSAGSERALGRLRARKVGNAARRLGLSGGDGRIRSPPRRRQIAASSGLSHSTLGDDARRRDDATRRRREVAQRRREETSRRFVADDLAPPASSPGAVHINRHGSIAIDVASVASLGSQQQPAAQTAPTARALPIAPAPSIDAALMVQVQARVERTLAAQRVHCEALVLRCVAAEAEARTLRQTLATASVSSARPLTPPPALGGFRSTAAAYAEDGAAEAEREAKVAADLDHERLTAAVEERDFLHREELLTVQVKADEAAAAHARELEASLREATLAYGAKHSATKERIAVLEQERLHAAKATALAEKSVADHARSLGEVQAAHAAAREEHAREIGGHEERYSALLSAVETSKEAHTAAQASLRTSTVSRNEIEAERDHWKTSAATHRIAAEGLRITLERVRSERNELQEMCEKLLERRERFEEARRVAAARALEIKEQQEVLQKQLNREAALLRKKEEEVRVANKGEAVRDSTSTRAARAAASELDREIETPSPRKELTTQAAPDYTSGNADRVRKQQQQQEQQQQEQQQQQQRQRAGRREEERASRARLVAEQQAELALSPRSTAEMLETPRAVSDLLRSIDGHARETFALPPPPSSPPPLLEASFARARNGYGNCFSPATSAALKRVHSKSERVAIETTRRGASVRVNRHGSIVITPHGR